MNKYKSKLYELFIGKQSLKKRFLPSFFSSLSLAFTLFLFGPLDLSYIAESYVNYKAIEILPQCLLVFAVIFSGMLIISWIPGGKFHCWITSIIAGLSIAFYIQGNFLNPDLGTLDGTFVEWHQYGVKSLFELLIFVLIMLIPLWVYYFSQKSLDNFLIFIGFLLVSMQIVPLGMMLIKDYNDSKNERGYYLSQEKEFTLGKENIVVFILDNTSPRHIQLALEEYPNMLDSFNDFNYFDNYGTLTHGTFPSVATMLTHQKYDKSIPYSDWFKNAWSSEDCVNFYSDMKENGWNTQVFQSIKYTAGSYENEYGLIKNVKRSTDMKYTINHDAFRKLIKLSFYRYFPLAMKAPFWIYTDDINNMKLLSEPDADIGWTDAKSTEKFWEKGLQLGNDEKVYVYYHYRGAHHPLNYTDHGRISADETPWIEQLAGHFYIIENYIQQMKSLGVYDNSSIIITADHGDFNYPTSILFVKPAHQHQDEMTISHAPLSQLNYLSTIAKFAGINYAQYGDTFYDIPEDKIVERCTEIRFFDDSLPKTSGKASNAIKKFCYTGGFVELHNLIMNDQYDEIIPLKYPFY